MLTRTIGQLRARCNGKRTDGGFSLTELLVVIVILGVVSLVVSAAIISSLRTSRVTEANVLGATEARIVLERTSLDIRTADPLRSADADSITLDTYRKGQCERRTYYLSGDELLLDVAPFGAGVKCGVYGSTPGAAVTSTIASGLTNDDSNPLFTYYKWDSTTEERVEVPAPVASSAVPFIDTVEIEVGIEAREQSDVGMSTVVDLRNVEVS